MTNSKKLKTEAANSNSGCRNEPNALMASHCFVIHQEDRQPDDDETVDEEQIYYGIYFYTASSKEQALELRVQELLGEDFWELESDERLVDEVPEWTDGWTNSTLTVYAMEEDNFWEYLGWEEEFWGKELVAWAENNRALALELLTTAKAGQGLGHQALAKHLGFLSVVEQAELQQEIPTKKGARKSRTPTSL